MKFGIRRIIVLRRTLPVVFNVVLSWKVLERVRFMDLSMSSNSIDGRPLTICTHDGPFHSDEALGCYLLKILHPKACIVRSRDPKVHENSDIVLDVGSIYDPKLNRYDHHQQSFTETMSSLSSVIKSSVRLSSAGLIYHHFGRLVLEKITGETNQRALDYLYRQLYYSLIQEIDGIDNGIPQFESEPLYNICSHISSRVSRLNIPWNNVEKQDETAQFHRAIDLVGEEFQENIKTILEQKYPAREIVQQAIENRYNIHPSGEIIELKKHCPWKSHFFELEKEGQVKPQIKYVIFDGRDTFRVQCVSMTQESYDCRKFLPESWRGLREEVLSKKAGIEGCVFVHANGFIGGHKSRDGALQMAIKSLEDAG